MKSICGSEKRLLGDDQELHRMGVEFARLISRNSEKQCLAAKTIAMPNWLPQGALAFSCG